VLGAGAPRAVTPRGLFRRLVKVSDENKKINLDSLNIPGKIPQPQRANRPRWTRAGDPEIRSGGRLGNGRGPGHEEGRHDPAHAVIDQRVGDRVVGAAGEFDGVSRGGGIEAGLGSRAVGALAVGGRAPPAQGGIGGIDGVVVAASGAGHRQGEQEGEPHEEAPPIRYVNLAS